MNHVAGIIDAQGNLRVVSTRRKIDFRHHRKPGERMFIVPGLRVPDPIPWNDIPLMMAQVENHILVWISRQNDPDSIELGPVGAYRRRLFP